MIAVLTPCGSTLSLGFVQSRDAMLNTQPGLAKAELSGNAFWADRVAATTRKLPSEIRKVLLIEADMRFPADTAKILDDANQPIIGANYRQRTAATWTAAKHGAHYSSRGKTGREVVTALGCGVLLIDRMVFNVIPEPWWTWPWKPEIHGHVGQDHYFCRRASEFGFETLVDHDLSQRVAHIAGDLDLWTDRITFTQSGELFCVLPEGL